MQLGFDKQNITPSLPIQMSGYYPMRTAISIHDDLWVRTHVFLNRTSRELFIFSTFDLVAVDVKLKESVLETLNQKFPDYKTHVFMAATHTHSAPAGTLDTREGLKQSFKAIFGPFNQKYFEYCVEQCLLSIKKAMSTLQTFHYKLLKDEVGEVGKDRHDSKNEGDPSLVVLEFTVADGKKSLLYIYSCHPTILNQENKQISADLPWGVTHLLEDAYEIVQFINGNSGNISTRYTRNTADFKQIEYFGEILADAMLKVQKEPPQSLESIQVWTGSVDLEVKGIRDEYLDILEIGHIKNVEKMRLDYSIIQFGPLLFVTMPGELTSDLAQLLKKKFPNLFVLGYTNDYLFYFASKRLYEANEYEALSSFLKKGEMERFMHKISKQMEGII